MLRCPWISKPLDLPSYRSDEVIKGAPQSFVGNWKSQRLAWVFSSFWLGLSFYKHLTDVGYKNEDKGHDDHHINSRIQARARKKGHNDRTETRVPARSSRR